MTKKYQLRRMLLINVGTNNRRPSNRITEIDPRGGASVLGENGVGKSTTLRILPLFFGHLPSQIMASGQGQEAMIRFLLPTDASAIAFEYQRGSDEPEDLRLAVIRRRSDDPDVPFYRLYRTGFTQDLFVSDLRFLNDEETQAKASLLGIQSLPKLTTSDYRSVILRAPGLSKQRGRLQQYAVDWSFGPRQLDNLDRVVAAMVKKHVNFADIVQVAVSLVQNNLGHGGDRARLTFKQGKAPIERWLRNREACKVAFQLTPTVDALRERLEDHQRAEDKYRTYRADVAALTEARKREAADLKIEVGLTNQVRDEEVRADESINKQLEAALKAASLAHTEARTAFVSEQEKAGHFERERAAHWAQKITEIPTLQARRGQIEDQINVATAAQQEAAAKYEKLRADAGLKAQDACKRLEAGKQHHRDLLSEERAKIDKSQETALSQSQSEFDARRDEIDSAIGPLQGEEGTWIERTKNPMSTQESERAATVAQHKLVDHVKALAAQQGLVGTYRTRHQKAVANFAAQEKILCDARAALGQAEENMATAQAYLNPPDGTLLAALRSYQDGQWRKNLAKVIHPELLSRQDLDPALVDDAEGTLYGWQLNTGVIDKPSWSDDDLALRELEFAQQRIQTAKTRLDAAKTDLERASAEEREAQSILNTTSARLSSMESQKDEIESQSAAANGLVAKEKKEYAGRAATELEKVRQRLSELGKQRKGLGGNQKSARAEIIARFGRQKTEAEDRCVTATSRIDQEIKRVNDQLTSALQELTSQLNEHLSQAGVDVARLNDLHDDLTKTKEALAALQDRVPLVESWRAWIKSSGPTHLQELEVAASKAATALGTARATEAMFKQEADARTKVYSDAIAAKEARQREVDVDLDTLATLDGEFEDYQATGSSVIDLKTTANSMRSKVGQQRNIIDSSAAQIRRDARTLRQHLTSKESSVKEFVEASLDEMAEANEIRQARALCLCHRQIGPQVLTEVNLTLRTLLANIGSFHKNIRNFEHEVSSFNRKLQEGLVAVKRFERLNDLRLEIVTNFEGLGFYRKLSKMEEVVRMHAQEPSVDHRTQLPPEETARTLGDFMSVLGSEGNLEVNVSSHITVKGSVIDNGIRKEFKRANELEGISSTGLTSLVLITLMMALLNTIRGDDPVFVPWITDEVATFDASNFRALMKMLQENHIDVVTASPELGPVQQTFLAHNYMFMDQGRILVYDWRGAAGEPCGAADGMEAVQ